MPRRSGRLPEQTLNLWKTSRARQTGFPREDNCNTFGLSVLRRDGGPARRGRVARGGNPPRTGWRSLPSSGPCDRGIPPCKSPGPEKGLLDAYATSLQRPSSFRGPWPCPCPDGACRRPMRKRRQGSQRRVRPRRRDPHQRQPHRRPVHLGNQLLLRELRRLLLLQLPVHRFRQRLRRRQRLHHQRQVRQRRPLHQRDQLGQRFGLQRRPVLQRQRHLQR